LVISVVVFDIKCLVLLTKCCKQDGVKMLGIKLHGE
jgi:hypothetical protein